jgi:hypothetical protein
MSINSMISLKSILGQRIGLYGERIGILQAVG